MPLDRYFSILKKESQPQFLYLASVFISLSNEECTDSSVEILWEIHDKTIKSSQLPNSTTTGHISLLELKQIIASKMLGSCEICENRCGIDRTSGLRGKCGVGEKSFYSSEFLHYGEEPELVPSHTVFFTGCTFKCIFCQNWDIAHGYQVKSDSGFMADDHLVIKILEKETVAKNLNLVGGNPDQHIANILEILVSLAKDNYSRPIVWNSNLYATPETMKLLEGIVDLHLADFKYGENFCAEKLSGIENYFEVITRNLLLAKNNADILIRHLVLPGHIDCCTSRVIHWVKENLPDAQFNLMFQYHPDYRADDFPEINRFLTSDEKRKALKIAAEAGIHCV